MPTQADTEQRDYSDAEREAMAKNGTAMPDGSFPIANKSDLGKAIHMVGLSKHAAATVKAFIIKRAKALDAMSMIPDGWSSQQNSANLDSYTIEDLTELRDATDTVIEERRKRGPRKRAVAMARSAEWRTFDLAEDNRTLEVRDGDKNGNIVQVVGTPIVYNSAYTVRDMLGEFSETMLPGVATRALNSGDHICLLWNHDTAKMPFATNTGQTMRFTDTPDGLQFVADVDIRQSQGNDLILALERGDISKMSCGFVVAQHGDNWNSDMTERSINSFETLLEVSAVNWPASPATSVAIAQRMVADMPMESRTRLDKILIEHRAGKVLSTDNKTKLSSALDLLSAVFQSSEPNEPADIDDPEMDDGSAAGISDSDPMVAENADGDGTAVEDVEVHPASQEHEDLVTDTPDAPNTRAWQLEAELLSLRKRH